MSVVRKWRDHHRSTRDLRALDRAVRIASSDTMREELLAAARRQSVFTLR